MSFLWENIRTEVEQELRVKNQRSGEMSNGTSDIVSTFASELVSQPGPSN